MLMQHHNAHLLNKKFKVPTFPKHILRIDDDEPKETKHYNFKLKTGKRTSPKHL